MKNFILLISVTLSGFIPAQSFILQSFATGFTAPVEIANAGDNRLFVVQQNGIIKIVQPNGTVNSTNFLDIGSKITFGGERGLLGLAFHPQYATNGKFYVYYNATGTGNITVAKYLVNSTNPDIANVASEEVLLNIPKPFSNHNGGCINFAPDGNLWISTGDGGSGGDPQNHGQNINSLLGKMLRINVDGATGYTIPANNPFAGATAGSDEIWSYGLRNAWKYSFDTTSGNVLIADVGQGEFEEINKIPVTQAGVNYGWKCYEGNDPYDLAGCAAASTMTFPVAVYDHSGGACSITGGYVYRGTTYPTLVGQYFFADFCSNQIGMMSSSNAITWTTPTAGSSFTTFGQDNQNGLYVASAGNGTVYKITSQTLGTSEVSNENAMSVYPNPASDKIFVKGFENKNLTADILSIDGRQVLNSKVENDFSIDISSLKTGVYFVTIKSDNTKVYTQKIIVK